MWLYFLASDSCTAVGQLSEADNCRQDRPMSTASRCRSFRPMSVVEAYSTHSTHCCSTICTSCLDLLGNVPLLHTSTLHVTSFTRPSPALVLQATNAGVRRPGNEARGSASLLSPTKLHGKFMTQQNNWIPPPCGDKAHHNFSPTQNLPVIDWNTPSAHTSSEIQV